VPPCNVGPVDANYRRSPVPRADAVDGTKVFAGQRAEGFYVDLGSIFDLVRSDRFRART